MKEPKIVAWKETIQKQGCSITTITPLQFIYKQSGDLLFGLCDATVLSPEGMKLPHIIMVRGSAVVIIIKACISGSHQSSFVMVRQYRIGSGRFEAEFPAGMVDTPNSDPLGVAIKEVQEETGIELCRHELFLLNKEPLYTSPGLHDESLYYYGCVKTFSPEDYESLPGRVCGVASENEKTHVCLMSKEQILSHTRASQVLLGLYLFENYNDTREVTH